MGGEANTTGWGSGFGRIPSLGQKQVTQDACTHTRTHAHTLYLTTARKAELLRFPEGRDEDPGEHPAFIVTSSFYDNLCPLPGGVVQGCSRLAPGRKLVWPPAPQRAALKEASTGEPKDRLLTVSWDRATVLQGLRPERSGPRGHGCWAAHLTWAGLLPDAGPAEGGAGVQVCELPRLHLSGT